MEGTTSQDQCGFFKEKLHIWQFTQMRCQVFSDQRKIIHLIFDLYHKEEYDNSSCMHLSSLKLKNTILSLWNIKVQLQPTTSSISNTNMSKYCWKTAKAFIALSQSSLILWFSREYNFHMINYQILTYSYIRQS